MKYVCCKCDEDVTAAVYLACRETIGRPLDRNMPWTRVDTMVIVQCSNGHDCEYRCPEDTGGVAGGILDAK
jgi:hypothetical protein